MTLLPVQLPVICVDAASCSNQHCSTAEHTRSREQVTQLEKIVHGLVGDSAAALLYSNINFDTNRESRLLNGSTCLRRTRMQPAFNVLATNFGNESSHAVGKTPATLGGPAAGVYYLQPEVSTAKVDGLLGAMSSAPYLSIGTP